MIKVTNISFYHNRSCVV